VVLCAQFNFYVRTISFIKVQSGKEAIKEFPVQMFVKLERSRESADDSGLYVTVGSDKPYKKALWFQSVAERGITPSPFLFFLSHVRYYNFLCYA
jgi:hypothetical protein